MGVYELSGAGSVKTGRTLYTSMNAGNMYGAMVPIATVEANSGSTTNPMSFTNIPQTYQDLMLVVFGRATNADTTNEYAVTINNDYTTIYSRTILQGNGSAASSTRTTGDSYYFPRYARTGASATSGIFGASTTHFLNYANTSTFKTIVSRAATDVNGSGFTTLTCGLYRSTTGINRLDLFSNGGNWTFGSTATLYGIRAVSS
jgi:hypothetical protein